MQDASHKRSPVVALCVAIAAVSTSSILIRLTSTPPLITAFYRQLFCAVLILPFAGGEAETRLTARDRVLLALSGLFLALHFATWITSLSYTTVARSTLFVDLQPVWAAILGAVFLQERLTLKEIGGVLLVTVGGIVTVGGHWHSSEIARTGDLLALAGGVAGAGYLLIGRKVRAIIPWARYMLAAYAISALWLLGFCLLFSRGQFPRPIETDLVWIALMAIGPGIFGHGLINYAIRHIKAYAVNAALLGEPVLATLLAYALFHEVPDAYYYAGALLIFSGFLLIFLRRKATPQDNA